MICKDKIEQRITRIRLLFKGKDVGVINHHIRVNDLAAVLNGYYSSRLRPFILFDST